MTCPATSLFNVDLLHFFSRPPNGSFPHRCPCHLYLPAQPLVPSPLTLQPWPAAAPPGQQLFGLVGEDGTVCFHHAGQRGGDTSLQKPLHTHVYKVLLVLGRRKGSNGERARAISIGTKGGEFLTANGMLNNDLQGLLIPRTCEYHLTWQKGLCRCD